MTELREMINQIYGDGIFDYIISKEVASCLRALNVNYYRKVVENKQVIDLDTDSDG